MHREPTGARRGRALGEEDPTAVGLAHSASANTAERPSSGRSGWGDVRENHDVHRERWGEPRIGEPDPFSSATSTHGVTLPDAMSYFLKRARGELEDAR
jgi:hypothetical protein